MQVKTALARAIDEADKPILDSTAKRILSNKYILAWIMRACVEEYKGLDINEIAERYIEGEPRVASVPVHRDESGEPMLLADRNNRDNNECDENGERAKDKTEKDKEKNEALETEIIHGIDSVDKSETEHNTLYDILFYATLPDSEEKIGMFINVEAQGVYKLKYPLIKRSIYYGSRMISAQFQRDFADGDYGKLKKVYSIWICANVPDKLDNTITKYSLTEEQILGHAEEDRMNYDLMNVIMVRFNDNNLITASPDESGEQEVAWDKIRTGKAPEDLVQMLRYLFTVKNGKTEKKQILQEAYNIPMTRELEEEVEKMCNLSQGISAKSFERGMQQGMQQGVLQGKLNTALKMLKKKMPIDSIIEFTELTLEQLKEIAQENGLELVTE